MKNKYFKYKVSILLFYFHKKKCIYLVEIKFLKENKMEVLVKLVLPQYLGIWALFFKYLGLHFASIIRVLGFT